ncbi:MAG TPA: hypothetical protein VJT31_31315 [Rugosimonospora sp.]|nr:hypothetical protein [Rugosimonospora sp.]
MRPRRTGGRCPIFIDVDYPDTDVVRAGPADLRAPVFPTPAEDV